jgi:hypothetical protein
MRKCFLNVAHSHIQPSVSIFEQTQKMSKIFNRQIFTTERPFLKQVFNKEFDAFFFINFPKSNPFDGISSCMPSSLFLNNIQQKNIYVSDIDGTKNLQFTFNQVDWQTNDAYLAYITANTGGTQYLFWHSEGENWGMISDTASEFALIGVDWNIADQIKLFFDNYLISPNQAIEKLQLQDNREAFFERYKPKDVFEKGNEKNPMWIKFIFDCHVENENDKLFYWLQFEPLYFSLTKVLEGLKGVDMYADQVFWRQYYQNKQWYTTGKNAPVGGWQAFSHKNCHKVATKFLTANLHLQLQFEGRQEEANKLIRDSKIGLISFMNFWIYANKERQSQKGYASAFYFKLSGIHAGKNDVVNQRFEFYLREDLIEKSKVDDFVSDLVKIGFAISVYKLRKPYIFAKYVWGKPTEIISMNNFSLDYNDLELYLDLTNQ